MSTLSGLILCLTCGAAGFLWGAVRGEQVARILADADQDLT